MESGSLSGVRVMDKTCTIGVKESVLTEMRSYKVHPNESDSDCLGRMCTDLREYKPDSFGCHVAPIGRKR